MNYRLSKRVKAETNGALWFLTSRRLGRLVAESRPQAQ